MNTTTARRPAKNEPADDMDEMRDAMARRISRFIADEKQYWRGCKEPACRRQRACVAPHIHCSNAPPPPDDPDGRLLARGQAMFLRMLKAVQEKRAAEEAEGEAKRK